MDFKISLNNVDEMHDFGRLVGQRARGGEVIELHGDLGAGKTTLAQGIARGLGIDQPISSPTFTISNQIVGRLELHHYDFYRLGDNPGIVSNEIIESFQDKNVVTLIEWADVIRGILPDELIRILIATNEVDGRDLTIKFPNNRSYLFSEDTK